MKTAISFIMKFQFQHKSKLEKSFQLLPSFFLEEMKTLSEGERESSPASFICGDLETRERKRS